MNQIVPPSFLFDYQCRIPRIDGLPGSKKWTSLPDTAVVFVPSQLNGVSPAFELRAGWNPGGLALSVTVREKRMPALGRADQLKTSDYVSIMMDTRHTANVHRATGYCTAINALPVDEKNSGRPTLLPTEIAQQRDLKRSLKPENCRIAASVKSQGYQLSVWLPADELPGFEQIAEIGRIGLYVVVHDTELGVLPLNVGDDFPTGFDPSMWLPFELSAD